MQYYPPRSAEGVTDYRVYLLDPRGRIQAACEVEAANDEGALAIATDLEHTHGVEVWQRARRVAVITPEARTAN